MVFRECRHSLVFPLIFLQIYAVHVNIYYADANTKPFVASCISRRSEELRKHRVSEIHVGLTKFWEDDYVAKIQTFSSHKQTSYPLREVKTYTVLAKLALTKYCITLKLLTTIWIAQYSSDVCLHEKKKWLLRINDQLTATCERFDQHQVQSISIAEYRLYTKNKRFMRY